jgi:UDP-GlcNAc3NAcA epimerase
MLKVTTVIGARPQFIKAATVSREFSLRGDVEEVIVHTGQHYDANMSDIFFEELQIPRPRHQLGIGGGSHGAMTGRMLMAIEEVILSEGPDVVLVYGDTNSTLAAALAATKLHVPVAHVEAGLRSFNRKMPEEINRILTDHSSDFLFAPTATATANLRAEGLADEKVRLVGDVMFDAALFYKDRARAPTWFVQSGIAEGAFVLATIHRAENTDSPERLQGILDGLARAGMPVLLPLHPRTRTKVAELNLQVADNIRLVEPLGYLEMVWLEAGAALIATDSGGVQKEAFFHQKPCVTLRDETEWVELIESGWNRLAGADAERIAYAIANAHMPPTHPSLYGRGNAAAEIVAVLA